MQEVRPSVLPVARPCCVVENLDQPISHIYPTLAFFGWKKEGDRMGLTRRKDSYYVEFSGGINISLTFV